MKFAISLLFTIILVSFTASAQDSNYSFKIIPLGVKGGVDESNLSCYMVAPKNSDDYVCLDAGTLYYGIQKTVDSGLFHTDAFHVLKSNIKGYLISHAHLDHVAGLIINAPVDTTKYIYGLPACLEVLQKDYFTWESWANFADAGEKPALGKYHYITLQPLQQTNIINTAMSVKAFTLSHSNPYQSTAFLINHNDDYLLYLGDTGADTVEHSNSLQQLWQAAAPLINAGKLKAIFIEVSFDNSQPEKQLFGHLTPKLLMSELHKLATVSSVDELKKVPIVITHIKPSEQGEGAIKQQLSEANKEGFKLVFPQQAKLLKL